MTARYLQLGVVLALGVSSVPATAMPRCASLASDAAFAEAPPEQYQQFCLAHPTACQLDGAPVLDWSEGLFQTLAKVNRSVNEENEAVSDWERTGLMDVWDFPYQCQADCEDYALAKRERLVSLGLPRAAFTMATVMHETQFFPHAVLLAETTHGTWLLDDLSDTVLCWDAAPYLYIRRERPDGQWWRYPLP